LRSAERCGCVSRRPKALRGRRLAFLPALALAALLVCGSPPAASADQAVVSATIYPASAGKVSQASVGLQALGACPEYSGSNPIYLYPPGQPFQLTATSWSLSTVISCGLQIPLDDVNSVQILNPNTGFQAPLSNADVTDPTQYQDPQAPDALPVVSVDGGEDQTTYLRPFRGGADTNARDEVTETGAPITLVVYANGPPLVVRASARTLSSTATVTTAKFSATVLTAAGTPVPASALTWNWTFGDGGTSAAVTPTHRFQAGSYEVTVQVSDASAGTGGTATIQFRTPAKPTSGHTNQTGARRPTKSGSPTGTENGKHSQHPGGQTGSHRSSSHHTPTPTTSSPATTTTPSTTTSPSAQTTTPPTTTTATAATPPAATTTTATTARPHRTARPRHTSAPPTAPSGPLVAGRLISDVTTLPAGSSPLVHLTGAAATAPPQVRQATHSRSLTAPGAALALMLLLGSGAWWELRGRRRSRAALIAQTGK
jgi:PKD domain